MEDFVDFIRNTLAPAIPAEQVVVLTDTESISKYFLKAFTHKTYIHDELPTGDSPEGEYNYEILEKLGDRTFNASFQMWMYDVIGGETDMLQPYSDIDKRYTGTDYLNILADNLHFTEHVFYVGEEVTKKMKEDVVEAFVGALVLASDEYVAEAFNSPDIGVVLAKRWIYSVLNRHLRREIDITDVFRYVDKRSRVNEIWHFNKWPSAVYLSPKAVKGQTNFRVTLKSPTAANLPQRWRNIELGVGVGETLALAREQAAARGLAKLEANFFDLVRVSPDLEVRYEYLNLGKVRRWLEKAPNGRVIYSKLIDILLNKHIPPQSAATANIDPGVLRFENVLARAIKVKSGYSAQVRLKINGSWKNEFRGHGATKEEAIADAVTNLIDAISVSR